MDAAAGARVGPRLCFSLNRSPGVSAMFAELPLPAALASASALGFSGVEGAQPEDPHALRASLDEAGLAFACMSFGRGGAGELGCAALPGREREFRAALDEAVRSAAVLGCCLIHPLAGLVPHAGEEERCHAVYRANLELAAAEADAAGLTVVVEPLSPRRQPRYLLHSHAQVLELLATVAGRGPGLVLDMFHAAGAGEDPAALAATHAAAIAIVQVADAPVRRQPAPGDARLAATARALAASGWDGWVSAEYEPQGSTAASLAWIAAIREAWAP